MRPGPDSRKALLRRDLKAQPAQAGQALVFGMLLAGMAILVLVRYFSTSQVAAAKARQLHALDAAAYSGALVQARALNMLAYLNRAQIGHQVAMAHLVTLGSWAAFGGAQARQLGSGNPPAYLIAMMFGPDHGAAYLAARAAGGLDALARTEGDLAHAYAAHDHIVQNVFDSVQQEIVAGLPDVRWAAMQAILAQNYPDRTDARGLSEHAAQEQEKSISPDSRANERFDLSILDDNWPGFLQMYSGQQRLRSFVLEVARLYDFLGPRNHTANSPWIVDEKCPALRHELRRRGNTELDAYGHWQSIDTESFHALRSNRWIGCYYREYPMGWGWIPSALNQSVDGPYTNSPPNDFAAQDFWRWVRDATNWDIHSGDANPLANSRAVAGRQRWHGGGLPMYFDTSTQQRGLSLKFTVALKHPGPGDLMVSTQSAAETFFERPEPRADGRLETGNLFHPYWQARLATPNSTHGAAKEAP
ncbi:hypothetical protein LSG25_03640 [Paralcaligenes sp. KSB-10]|uniref:hypothetical protein n=1 Tax=Paralcaligenes sp. KSB-10 TaxID=2901142 RepID=UPI001E3CA901|nr:hypothetical protein [Paralcaligenes sp. KSB-10]UHL65005.1 hypothetical protein LSG25_03640 [Paralcaligenes sp. KSB-10]